MNSSTRISDTGAGLRLVINIGLSSSVAVIVEIHAAGLAPAAIPGEDQTPLLVHPDRVQLGQNDDPIVGAIRPPLKSQYIAAFVFRSKK